MNKTKAKKTIKFILIIIASIIVVFFVCAIIFLLNYYHAGDRALEAMKSDDLVVVKEINSGYLFDGPGTEKAIIFYPGAKVEEEAYAPLLRKIAENDTDVFLVSMPFRLAVLGVNKADSIRDAYDYREWYMAGHSMGGAMAAVYEAKHEDEFDGVILFAAFATKKISDSERLLSIYGSNDTVLDDKKYNENKKNWPKESSECVIQGGNHAQFGDYGIQKGDGAAGISWEEQQRITLEYVKMFFE